MLKSFAGVGAAALIALGVALGGSAANAESVMKQCGDQWQAAKAAGTTNGETWPQFLSQCRAQLKTGAAAPAPAAPAPLQTTRACARCKSARRDDEDRKPVRRGIRGEQGRDQGLRADEARVCRRLPRGHGDDPAGGRRSSCARSCTGAGAEHGLAIPMAAARRACAHGNCRSYRRRAVRVRATGEISLPVGYGRLGEHELGRLPFLRHAQLRDTRSMALTCARLMRKPRVIGPRRTRSTREALKAAHATNPAIQTTGLLTLAPAGLSPAEHASLRWTHNRTCGSPASGSRTRPHAFVHDTSCPSRLRRTSPKCP